MSDDTIIPGDLAALIINQSPQALFLIYANHKTCHFIKLTFAKQSRSAVTFEYSFFKTFPWQAQRLTRGD